jgi:hypothetical protein
MADWGHCHDCKWWEIEPGAPVDDSTMGVCIETELRPFQLRVAGCSGCNHFAAGKPVRAEGAAAEPPVVTARPS